MESLLKDSSSCLLYLNMNGEPKGRRLEMYAKMKCCPMLELGDWLNRLARIGLLTQVCGPWAFLPSIAKGACERRGPGL